MNRARTTVAAVRRRAPLALTAIAIVAVAVMGMSRFASASLVNVAPRALTVHVVTTRPNVPNVLRVVADSTQACLVIAVASCTNVRNARSYVKFNLSSLPAGATVQSATLHLSGGPTTISAAPVTARRVTTAWSESTMTYNSRPTTSSSGVVTGAAVASGGTEVLTLDVTAMVVARGTATIANGWELRPNGTNDSWWYSSEWSTASQRPTLTVVYR